MHSILTPVKGEHSEKLFSLIVGSKITETIQWDGPESFDEFQQGLSYREAAMKSGDIHMFTIIDPESGDLVGSIDIRPYESKFSADIGLWIGEKFQGKGLGTKAVNAISDYGFTVLNLDKIEGYIFKGNIASCRTFEKCGFKLEGTIRSRVKKRGELLDEWIFGKLAGEHLEEKK